MRILLVSTIYPTDDPLYEGTKVCHYFTQQWIKMGYEVKVVHSDTVLPRIFFLIGKIFYNYARKHMWSVVYFRTPHKTKKYNVDDVPVLYLPVLRPIPHHNIPKFIYKMALKKIVAWLIAESYKPDVIIGHFGASVPLVSRLKDYYPESTTCYVNHGELFPASYFLNTPPLSNIDIFGFRAQTCLDDFKKRFGPVNNCFICYSGIPDTYLTNIKERNFSKGIKNFIYVGTLIERKYPSKIIPALAEAYGNSDFAMEYIGEGAEFDTCMCEVKKYNMEDKVKFVGRIPRDDIKKHYDYADCMIMISRAEAYGLVYLEAMSRGCITIGSRREGADGIIIDGQNGFLCNAGDEKELASILKRIRTMPSEELNKISKAAMLTVSRMTDKLVAEHYINSIMHIKL